MSAVLENTIEVSLVILAALATSALLRNRSAALRHWVIATGLLCAAATPLLEPVVPSWHLGLNAAPVGRVESSSVSVTGPTLPHRDSARSTPAEASRAPREEAVLASVGTVSHWLWPLWMVGVAISLCVLLVGLARMAYLASRAQRIQHGTWVELAGEISREYGLRQADLRQSDHPTLLATWGLLRPTVILPAAAREWSERRARVVLRHELAHIRRGDWAIQLIAELVLSIYWFNPLVWIACKRLRLESERACDDAVLNGGVEGHDYATHLLDVARALSSPRRMRLPAPAMARRSSLERRISAMLNAHINRKPISRAAKIATVISLLGIAVLVAGFGASAQSSSATVSGTVHDQSGAVVPGVPITLTQSETQRPASIMVLTDANGYYAFDLGLPPGDYVLEAQHKGFRKVEQELRLEAEQAVRRDLTLHIGTVQETIVVWHGDAPPRPPPAPPPPTNSPRLQPAPDSRTAATSSAVVVGGNIKRPEMVGRVDPVYPADLRDAGIRGRVALKARIDTDGSLTAVEVVASPHPALAGAALEAVSQWQYEPTLLNGVPVETDIEVTVDFGGPR